VRGPLVAAVTPTSAVISWWTNEATPGVVSWGLSSHTENRAVDPAGTAYHHVVAISGLTPGNRYVYARTPWGSTVELVTYPSTQAYQAGTPLRRWRPPATSDHTRQEP